MEGCPLCRAILAGRSTAFIRLIRPRWRAGRVGRDGARPSSRVSMGAAAPDEYWARTLRFNWRADLRVGPNLRREAPSRMRWFRVGSVVLQGRLRRRGWRLWSSTRITSSKNGFRLDRAKRVTSARGLRASGSREHIATFPSSFLLVATGCPKSPFAKPERPPDWAVPRGVGFPNETHFTRGTEVFIVGERKSWMWSGMRT